MPVAIKRIFRISLMAGFIFLSALSPAEDPFYVVDPSVINYPGKIWLQNNLLLVNDLYTGVHFFDISDPRNPQRLYFLTISNNVDIAVKNNILYADSYGHLLAYDITVLTNPVLVSVQSNAVGFPVDVFAWNLGDDTMEPGFFDFLMGFGCSCAAVDYASDGVSTGGSTARFSIAGNVLYTLKDGSAIQAFDITDPAHPQSLPEADISEWDAQTLFPYQDKLFVGTMNGMLIYDISNPIQPRRISQFVHARASDPVIVHSDVAYFTLQNAMDYPWNRLEAVFLNDYTNLLPLTQVSLYNPLGLAAQGDYLYVCDSYQGLAMFHIADYNAGVFSQGIGLLGYAETGYAYDLIPFSQYLILSGGVVSIYTTTNSGVPEWISTLY